MNGKSKPEPEPIFPPWLAPLLLGLLVAWSIPILMEWRWGP